MEMGKIVQIILVSSELSSKIILGETLKIGSHSYISNWLVANCRYYVLLGMAWHISMKLRIDYETQKIELNFVDI